MNAHTPDGGDLRRRILDASIELVAAEGLAGLSMREVARRAGVSHQAPYHHFRDREAILAALAQEGFQALNGRMIEATEGAKNLRERLVRCGLAYVRFALAYPSHFRIMFRPDLVNVENFPECERAGQGAFQHLVATVEAMLEGSELQRDRDTWIGLIWSTTHGLAGLLLDGPLSRMIASASDDAYLRGVVELLVDLALGSQPQAPAAPRKKSPRRRQPARQG
ncbi:MAG: TetR/AcrR family transcriptional regulator [Polyangiaceae bacterium]|jgi:AcrR family transcriptional regulator|nr:TetR/AcrR family transcriptional regulator [Polyangiaceae bacterium]